jgi:hypothetical protein
MKTIAHVMIGAIALIYCSSASGMLRIIRKPSHAHSNYLLCPAAQQRKCHYVSVNEREEIMQTLKITNGAIRSACEQDQKRIALILKRMEIGQQIIKANNESLVNLEHPDCPDTVYDTNTLCKTFNELGKQLERIGQSFE